MRARQKVSRDANHNQVVDDLVRCGYSVYDGASVGGGAPDFIVADRNGRAILVELKATAKSSFYLGQLDYLSRWVGHAMFATTFTEIHRAFTDRMAGLLLSPDQKRDLQNFVFLEKRRAEISAPTKDWRGLKVSAAKVLKVVGK